MINESYNYTQPEDIDYDYRTGKLTTTGKEKVLNGYNQRISVYSMAIVLKVPVIAIQKYLATQGART